MLARRSTIATERLGLREHHFACDTLGPMNWGIWDFLVFAGMLGLSWAGIRRVRQKPRPRPYTAAWASVIASLFFLVWANLAVGVIGSEDNPVNLLLFLPYVLVLISAYRGRGQPAVLARAAAWAAGMQLLLGVLAWSLGWESRPFIWVFTGIYVLSWLFAAWAFGRCSTEYCQSIEKSASEMPQSRERPHSVESRGS
ncbi:MAG: hypothetical protein RLY30_863 [Pseudomonadota bacterium]|jgi:hypothetical protein